MLTRSGEFGRGKYHEQMQVWLEDQFAQNKKLNEIAQARGQSMAQMAIAWTLRKPAITSSLIGASSVKQLEDNLAALGYTGFTVDEVSVTLVRQR